MMSNYLDPSFKFLSLSNAEVLLIYKVFYKLILGKFFLLGLEWTENFEILFSMVDINEMYTYLWYCLGQSGVIYGYFDICGTFNFQQAVSKRCGDSTQKILHQEESYQNVTAFCKKKYWFFLLQDDYLDALTSLHCFTWKKK